MRDRSEPIPPPFGAVERPRPCRELSALVDGDFAAPAITRRASAQLGRDLAVSAGAQRWEDVAPDLRAVMKEELVGALHKRLGNARFHVALLAGIGAVPLAAVERVARLERALAAASRLP